MSVENRVWREMTVANIGSFDQNIDLCCKGRNIDGYNTEKSRKPNKTSKEEGNLIAL